MGTVRSRWAPDYQRCGEASIWRSMVYDRHDPQTKTSRFRPEPSVNALFATRDPVLLPPGSRIANLGRRL